MKINRSIILAGVFLSIILSIYIIPRIYIISDFKRNGSYIDFEEVMTVPLSGKTNESKLKREVGDRMSVIENTYDPGKQVYFSIINLGKKETSPQVIVNGQDWFTNEGILENALQKEPLETDEDIVVALWKFMVKNRYHYLPPFYSVGLDLVDNPVKYLNNWGYGFCSDSAVVFAQLATVAGYKSRVVQLREHLVTEVYYMGGWHMLDVDTPIYVKNSQGNIASIEEIYEDKELIKIAIDKLGRPEQQADNLLQAYSGNGPDYLVYADSFYPDDLPATFSYTLRAGEEIRFYNNWQHKHYWGYKEEEPPFYSNGLLITPINSKSVLDYFRQNDELVKVSLPYPIVGAYVLGDEACEYSDKILFSVDKQNWQSSKGSCQNKIVDFGKYIPIGLDTKPTHEYYIKLVNLNTPLRIVTEFQVAPKSIPVLSIGNNILQLRKALNENINIKFGYIE